MNYFLFLLLNLTASNAYNLPHACAPNNGIMTTPTYNTTGALFTVCAQVTINAYPSIIYNVLLDFQQYPLWNSFVYAVDLPSNVSGPADVYVGMEMTFHTSGLLPTNTTSNEFVTYLEPDAIPAFMAWRDDMGSVGDLVLQAEHVSLLLEMKDGSTVYVSWEMYYGVGAAAVLPLEANLIKEFEAQGLDLKWRAEALVS